MREDNAPAGTVFLSPGLALFVGRQLNSAPHRHFNASITISLEGPFRFRGAESEPWQEAQGLAAEPNALLEAQVGSQQVINVQLNPECADCAVLRALDFAGRPLLALGEPALRPTIKKLRQLIRKREVSGDTLYQTVLDAIGPVPSEHPGFEPRVARALARLKESFPEAPSSAQLASELGLSEGRLQHLFVQQLGVPLRRYVLSLRLRALLFQLAMGLNLTDAAHAAGFADSAHFSRVYRDMYGMPPSHLLRSPAVRIRFESPKRDRSGPYAEQDRQMLQEVLARWARRHG